MSLSFDENCDQIVKSKVLRREAVYRAQSFLPFKYEDFSILDENKKEEPERYMGIIVFDDGRWQYMVDSNKKIQLEIEFRKMCLEWLRWLGQQEQEVGEIFEGIGTTADERSLLRARLIKTVSFEMGLRKWLQDRLAFAAAARISKLEKWKQILYLTGENGFRKWSYFLHGCSWDFLRAQGRPTGMLERFSAIRDITKFLILQQLNTKALFRNPMSQAKADGALQAMRDQTETQAQQDGDNGERSETSREV